MPFGRFAPVASRWSRERRFDLCLGSGTVSEDPSLQTTFEQSELDISDLGTASATLRQMFGTGSADIVPGADTFRWHVRSHLLGGVRINRASVTRNAVVRSEWMTEHYIIVLLREGQMVLRHGSERVTAVPHGRGVVLSPPRAVQLELSDDSATLCLAVRRADLETHFEKLTQSELQGPLRFESSLDVSRGQGAALGRLVAFAASECDRCDGLPETPLMRKELRDSLLTAFVTCVPHGRPAHAHPRGRSIAPGHIRRAEAWIDAHANEAIGIAEMAAAAGVSARTLQEAFRRHRGVSPLQFLRARRLEIAHRKLLAAEPGATVASVAHSIGFCHLGRFAIEYRQRFHESPSDTLRRRGHT